MAPPVFKTGLAGNTLAGRFDSFPPPPQYRRFFCEREASRATNGARDAMDQAVSAWRSQSLKDQPRRAAGPASSARAR